MGRKGWMLSKGQAWKSAKFNYINKIDIFRQLLFVVCSSNSPTLAKLSGLGPTTSARNPWTSLKFWEYSLLPNSIPPLNRKLLSCGQQWLLKVILEDFSSSATHPHSQSSQMHFSSPFPSPSTEVIALMDFVLFHSFWKTRQFQFCSWKITLSKQYCSLLTLLQRLGKHAKGHSNRRNATND